MKIEDELIMLDLEVNTKEEALAMIGEKLYKLGFVTKDYVEGVLEREGKYPTGLPTVPYGVAIPHTDPDKVIEAKIAFATLKNPVTFSAMGSHSTEVEVKMVFMLALNNPNDQLEMLQKLTAIFQDEKIVSQLGNIKSIKDFHQLVYLYS
ncbi:PTS sugar transporter subunit IIA [Virgibacillus pantothenticus]|uniref:PTS sugar transporter subunit IIA n=1 Tax=Virgibacillus pantothenticus TaxID=1473 RepID=UPI00147BA07E|nr:PTS sugar transporter subunit IIA [Virgibacillus pantothenticus]